MHFCSSECPLGSGSMETYNFAAGPAAFPKTVLAEAAKGLIDWRGSGMSVMEMPFTGPEFNLIMAEAQATLRRLLDLPENFRILFLQGGAYGQFAFIPMNLLRGMGKADYAVTGHWSRRAAAEARKYGSVNIVADSSVNGFAVLSETADWELDPEAAYCHITTNETANGVQFHRLPDTGAVPLVADMTSDFMTAPLDMTRFGAVYASAQKNLGPAGLTIVIVREDLVGTALAGTPAVFDFEGLIANNSKINTPPTWAIYVAGLMFNWLEDEGGLAEMARRNRKKADLVYGIIDANEIYSCPVPPGSRSTVNPVFNLPNRDLDEAFVAAAAARGLLNLRGHQSYAGIRVSLYNAVTDRAVQALLDVMAEFAAADGKGLPIS